MLGAPKDLTDDRAWFWYTVRYYSFVIISTAIILAGVASLFF